MFATDIYTMLLNDGLSDSHFDHYKEYIRKRDHPTPEEIAKTQEQVEERKKHKLAQDMQNQKTLKLTHQFKASSRLDRLKAKNNIST